MNDASNAGLAALILRVAGGVLFLAHAWVKAIVFGFPGAVGYFQSPGLPGPLAYLIILLEVVGGVALILGFRVRYVAVVMGLELLGAAWFGHASNGWFFANPNGGWEYPVFWGVTMFALALLGDGAYSLEKMRSQA